MNLLQAIILAIVEGLTEFLPVSSTGHMIIASTAMGIATHPFVKVFTVAIQFGTILSVVVLYRDRFFQPWTFYRNIGIAFLPAVLFGFLLKKLIDQMLENVLVVAVALIAGGVFFLLLDDLFNRTAASETEISQLSWTRAMLIGLFQVVAMVPGVSRSAATIIGGLIQGLSPKAAAEFSFFLAVPTLFAASCKALWDYGEAGALRFTSQEIGLLALGNIVGFVVAMLAIKGFIAYLTRHGFRLFGYYRIAVGILLLLLASAGYFSGVDISAF
ncbi:MAG: undecaprenyl-diphosphate phosphatase [Saprospiraceae bacterium]|nr:undecaprenyl-diphosphate phosphatase [Saprospiraceae bacterium]MDW8484711.1 undecaprenyl-diphosphate phosphatase [Saprospiraceae bacterium]